MPASGDSRKLDKLAERMHTLASGKGTGLFPPINRAMKAVLREEFTRSIDPSGRTWQPTVKGRPALISRKLPNAFAFAARDGYIVGVGKTKRDLLTAHQEGHTFRARQVAALKNFLTFDKGGRVIAKRRALNRKGDVRRGVQQVFARAHEVSERVLPARPIVPEGSTLPRLWDGALRAGFTEGMTKWFEGAAK
jgi:hypothetical protein